MRSHYTIKPRTDHDIDDYAGYLARNASLDVALRFLAAADETFSLLATQPSIGWHARLRTRRLARYLCSASQGLKGCSILYRPLGDGVDILRLVHGSRKLQALLRRREEIE